MKPLQQMLENSSGIKLKLKINDNRSTMLSVKWEPDCAKVSLHRIFLDAPHNVMEDLACYLKSKKTVIAPRVKAFIADNLQQIDYSHELDRSKLYSKGHVYNLQQIYNRLNAEYFDGELDLSITWFGKPVLKHRTRVTFGLYHEPLRLIKINRLLDNPSYPDYVVAFVVYHEMVHHVCPAYYNKNGQQSIHSKEFKEMEARYKDFHMAQNWIKKNQANFFL